MNLSSKKILIANVLFSVCLGSPAFGEEFPFAGSHAASDQPWQVATLLPKEAGSKLPKEFANGTTPHRTAPSQLNKRIDTSHTIFSSLPTALQPAKEAKVAKKHLVALLGGGPAFLRQNSAPSKKAHVPECLQVPTPPAELETHSKYDQSDKSRSTVDRSAKVKRKKLVQPIRNSVRMLTKIAYAKSANPNIAQARAECVLKSLDAWAKGDALTKMQTSDALLSRDRWVAEFVLALNSVAARGEISKERKGLYEGWLRSIADSTVEAYSLRLGPKSRTNNHRYWAGLAVGAIGVFLEDEELKAWGHRSFEIGSCQVDANGLLPKEMSRGSKALEYHIYAYRPLAALARLHQAQGTGSALKCFDGFKRLHQAVARATQNPDEFEKFSGTRQKVNFSEKSYSSALRLVQLGV
ncbi:Alginate lyase precursor [Roseibium album]|nr:Alginate lyase precursor [Roseibium album]